MKIHDVVQGTPEWYAVRCGLVTASCFSDVMAGGAGKVRDLYMRKLAGEIITGDVQEKFSNSHMEHGNAVEDEARKMYQMLANTDVTQVGFIETNHGKYRVGCSPDGLVGDVGMVEIKRQGPHLLIDRMRNGAGDTHMPQLQGSMWIAEREWIDLVCYYPKMPLWRQRVRRDNNYIERLKVGITAFCEELDQLVDWVRRYR